MNNLDRDFVFNKLEEDELSLFYEGKKTKLSKNLDRILGSILSSHSSTEPLIWTISEPMKKLSTEDEKERKTI